MRIKLEHGCHVIYVDEVGVRHDALLTECWGVREVDLEDKTVMAPSINLVFILKAADRRDQWGQQKEHRSSCVHRSLQAAHGNYWMHPAEAVA